MLLTGEQLQKEISQFSGTPCRCASPHRAHAWMKAINFDIRSEVRHDKRNLYGMAASTAQLMVPRRASVGSETLRSRPQLTAEAGTGR